MKTSLFLILTAILVLIFSFTSTAQDNAQIGLPEGAIARLGKGSLGEIHFSPDGSKLAVSTSIGIWFHDPHTGKELVLLSRPHIVRPYTFAFSPDGNTIASNCWGKETDTSGRGIHSVEVWDVATGEDKTILVGNRTRVYSIAYSPDGETIATGGWHYDSTVRLWDAKTGENISTSRVQTKWDSFVVYSPDGSTYATVGDENTVHLWDSKTGKHKNILSGHTKRVFSAAYSPDGKTIATVSYDNTMRFWDATTGNHQTSHTLNDDKVTSMGYSPDGRTIVSGTVNGDVQIIDTQTMQLKTTFTGHTDRIKSVAYSPDGKSIASTSSDGTVRLWDVATGKTKAILTGYMHINSVAYSPDGRTIATGSGNNNVRLWDINTGKIKNTFVAFTGYGRITRVAYAPDGKTIAVARPYSTVFLLDSQTGKCKATLKHFGLIDEIFNAIHDREYDITALTYSPDGNTIVTGLDCYTHEKGSLYLWNAKTGKRKRVIFKGPGAVYTVVFSKDGKKIIATGDWKKKTRVWDAKTGKELTPTPNEIQRKSSRRILHSPDSTTTAHSEQNGTVIIRKRDATSDKE
ncbi:hypothetical protein F4212_00425 [Candidatus Poribacteria bacterium]|nr:hypothetical protein [Candidatus Poribacteria bacterium]